MVPSGADLQTKACSCLSLSTRTSPPTATPLTLASVFETSAQRFFTTPELIDLLSPSTSPLPVSSASPITPPPSGSVFLYDRSVTRKYKHDGHDWAKKLVSSKTPIYRVREDSAKLRHGTQYRLLAHYTRSAAGGGMRRRCYSLIDPDSLKPLSNLVLVHYLDTDAIPLKSSAEAGSASKPVLEDSDICVGKGSDSVMSSPSNAKTKNTVAIDRNRPEAYPHTTGRTIVTDTLSQGKGLVEPVTSMTIDSPETLPESDDESPASDNFSDSVDRSLKPPGSVITLNNCYSDGHDVSTLHARTAVNSPQHRAVASIAHFVSAPKITQEDMTKEWLSSTETERSAAIDDIYGSAASEVNLSSGWLTHAENNDFANELQIEIVEGKLSQMDNEIERVSLKSKLCYLEALKQSPHLASKRDFKLQFLRCESFCPRAAAHRMVNYWTQRVAIFGTERAFLPLTLEETMPNDYEDPGFHHVRLLPGTDASGRSILFIDNTIHCTRMTALRALWYMVHASLEDENARRNGCIVVIHKCSPPEVLDRQCKLEMQSLITNVLPLRLRALHLCHFGTNGTSGWITRAVIAALAFAAGKYFRSRVVFHDGSTEEVLVQLAEYGVMTYQLPTSIGGVVTDEEFSQWLELRRAAGR